MSLLLIGALRQGGPSHSLRVLARPTVLQNLRSRFSGLSARMLVRAALNASTVLLRHLFTLSQDAIYRYMAQTPYPTNDPEPLRRLAAAADVYLQGQLAAAVAADQRALVFAGFLAAATAALGGAAANVLINNSADHFVGRLAMCAAAGLLVAMLCAIVAARPTHWFFPGSHPKDWQEDFVMNKPEIGQLQELLVDYDERIDRNHTTMRINGRWITASAMIGMLTLFVAGTMLVSHFW
jgi:hypothetical protein